MTANEVPTLVPDPSTAPAIRWGILAPGGIAHRFAREVQQYTRSTIVAVGSRSLARAEAFVQDVCGDGAMTRAYGSYEELVGLPEVDAVYVASPHSEHHDHALLALRAGKPVLVEKAFTLNVREAEEVFAEARRRHLFAMEAMWSRFLLPYRVLAALIADGELGAIRAMQATHAQDLNLDPAWRMMNPALGGGALLDLGIYPISLAHFLFGVPDAIAATGVLTRTGVDLRETVTLRYGNRQAVAINDMAAQGRCNLQLIFERGRVEILDWFYTPQDIVVTPAGSEPYTLPTTQPGGFQYQAAEAARCVVGGLTESQVMRWKDTIEVLRITDEVRRQLGVVYPADKA